MQAQNDGLKDRHTGVVVAGLRPFLGLSPVLSQSFTRFAVQFDRRRRRRKKNSFFKTNNNNVIEQLKREDREPIIGLRNNGEVLLKISKVDCLRRASEKN